MSPGRRFRREQAPQPSWGCRTAAGVPAVLIVLALGTMAAVGVRAAPETPPSGPIRVPLAEGRRMVRMMDDIYRTGVMTAHRMYVQEPGVPAAVTWGKQVIRQINGKGWPEARIFDATGRPLNPENRPADQFERDAIAELRKGAPTVERVREGELRYASGISVVEKSCLACHVRSREGDLLGGVSYRLALSGE